MHFIANFITELWQFWFPGWCRLIKARLYSVGRQRNLFLSCQNQEEEEEDEVGTRYFISAKQLTSE
jgi:hypothetical protein